MTRKPPPLSPPLPPSPSQALPAMQPKPAPAVVVLPGDERLRRQSALLTRAPWMAQVFRAQGEPQRDPALAVALERSLQQFEELPDYAVSAIGTLLAEEGPAPRPPPAPAAAAESEASPEGALGRARMLHGDPAFALALHCVDTRLRPRLSVATSDAELAHVPESAWFGLLHAGGRPEPLLTARVAVQLVLRLGSGPFSLLPHGARAAALRLFGARATDLYAKDAIARLCLALPREWQLGPAEAARFVAAAGEARVGLADACSLSARIAAATRVRRGGLAALADDGALPASSAELAELQQTARRMTHVPGFVRLLRAL